MTVDHICAALPQRPFHPFGVRLADIMLVTELELGPTAPITQAS